MKRGAVLICLLLASCGSPPERVALEPFKISFESPPLELTLEPERLALEIPAELAATFPDFDPIGANVSPSEVELVNLSATIPISVERRRVRGRMRTFRTFPIPVEAPTDDPVLALSRVTASEEGWESPDGMGAIFQTATNIRNRGCNPERHSQCVDGRETTLSALRRLSSRVTGQRNPVRRRQLWTSTLPRGDTEVGSPYWRECPPGRRGARMRRQHLCEGTWAGVREFWNEIQSDAEERITGRRRGPCRGTPLAWGCPDCGDASFMYRRNEARRRAGLEPYVELDCGEVENLFYGIPPREDLEEVPEIIEEDRLVLGSVEGIGVEDET